MHYAYIVCRNAFRPGFSATYRALRRIQLYVGIVNEVNSYVIFSWKVMCISISIGAGYAAIAHFGDSPIFGLMYCLALANCVSMYTLSYGKAFKMSDRFREASTTAVLLAHKRKYTEIATFERQKRSFSRMGIKVGEFHFIERQSVLIFSHFVLNNIVSMLVANRPG